MAVALSAETPRWTRATPFGDRMVALTQSSSLPQTLYSATAEGRVYVSTNGGVAWRLRLVPLQAGETIRDLVADPLNARTLYLWTNSGLLRSRDGGASWTRVGIGLPVIQAVAPDRSLPGVVWAATQSGLYRSNDEGGTWQLAGLEGLFLTALAIDPRTPGTLLAGVKGDPLYSPVSIWHSTDHGETWSGSQIPPQLSLYVGEPRFTFDTAHPGTTYVFFINGGYFGLLFRTTDLGITWTTLHGTARFNDLASSPDGTLFGATDFGMSTSTDQGVTWVPPLPLSTAAPPNDQLVRILVSAAQPSHLLAAGSAGIWRSQNGGASWRDSSRGIVAPNASPVFASPTGEPALTTAAGSSVYRSVDQGATWTRLATRAPGGYSVRLAALHPHHPETMYRIDSDGRSEDLVKSTDGGRSWSILSLPSTCGSVACNMTINAVTFDFQDPETVYVAGRSPGPFLLRGDDSLQLLEGSPRLTGLIADPDRSGVLYGLNCQGLHKSLNAGVSWSKMGLNLPANACATALALDPREPHKMWLGLAGKGLFFSSNGGGIFQSMSRGLESGRIATILFDPAAPARVYAGISGRGVYRWNAARRQWARLPNPGLPAAGYTGILTLDPQNPSVLYASHPEHGIFRLDLEE